MERVAADLREYNYNLARLLNLEQSLRDGSLEIGKNYGLFPPRSSRSEGRIRNGWEDITFELDVFYTFVLPQFKDIAAECVARDLQLRSALSQLNQFAQGGGIFYDIQPGSGEFRYTSSQTLEGQAWEVTIVGSAIAKGKIFKDNRGAVAPISLSDYANTHHRKT